MLKHLIGTECVLKEYGLPMSDPNTSVEDKNYLWDLFCKWNYISNQPVNPDDPFDPDGPFDPELPCDPVLPPNSPSVLY